MRIPLTFIVAAVFVAWLPPVHVVGQTAAPVVTGSRVARTAWGDPDVSGLFTTDDELGVPFERPAQFADRQFVTAEEFAQRQSQSERQEEADREAFVVARPAAGAGPVAGGTGPPAHWIERGRPSRRTSLVIDPPDGRIPYLNDEARRRRHRTLQAHGRQHRALRADRRGSDDVRAAVDGVA